MKTARLIESYVLLLLLLVACQPTAAITPSPEVSVIPDTGTAIVISDVATLRSLPTIESYNMAIVERNTRLTIIGKLADGSWYQVDIPVTGETVDWLRVPEEVTSLWIAAPFVDLQVDEAPLSPEPTMTIKLPESDTASATDNAAPMVTSPVTTVATPTSIPTVCFLPPGWAVYTIRAGDTLGLLAQSVGSTVPQLMQVNCLDNDRIQAGQSLFVPRLPPTQQTPLPTDTPTPLPPDTPTPSSTPISTATGTPTPLPPDTPTSTNTPISSTVVPEPSTVVPPGP